MARQKRGTEKGNTARNDTQSRIDLKPFRTGVTIICLVIAASISFKGYLETRVNSRFDKEKMVEKTGSEVPWRYWGSYRSNLYFGMKTRDPYSLVSGLMWYFPKKLGRDGFGIRHWCEQGDNLEHYSWAEHDGRNFGIQKINDGSFHLETSFVKRIGGDYGGDWTARVTVSGRNNSRTEEVSLIFYTALDEKTDGWISSNIEIDNFIPGIMGRTSGLGYFKFSLLNQSGEIVGKSFLSTVAHGLHQLKESVISNIRIAFDKRTNRREFVLPGEVLLTADGKKANPNFVAVQITAKVPVDIAFIYESDSFHYRPNSLTGENYEKALNKHRKEFSRKFENTFKLHEKGFDEDQIAFAKAALSNLVGSIGYFYGTSRVQSSHTESPVPYWKAPLYTAVPSRSFFPRGFLWDEGFHGLLLAVWDLEIELDIINHWFDLMNVEGWIPREQILGQEALAKVPEEFVTQYNTNANPPVFFLTLKFILKNYGEHLTKDQNLIFLDNLYPRLQAWYDWFNVSQIGSLPGTYRWRGRDAETKRELNPKTLTSGLDDYPRASHPDDNERHLDLRCWIALASSIMADTSNVLGRNGIAYENTFLYLTDRNLLNRLHWSEKTHRYADYGLHTDAVTLKRLPATQSGSNKAAQNQEKTRVILKEPSYGLIDSAFGYVSLFPFLLEQLDKDSPELGIILNDLENPQLLWTDFGLRSLSKTSPLYLKYNTEHDPPYWRGPIWINLNYLAVKALHHYMSGDGVYSSKASDLYQKLRRNIFNNIYKEYKRTGYIWEQYNDMTGEGQGSRPFTGWSSLVVLLMGEIY